ncbi:MAG: hypothetical protein H7Z41_17975, partial [Cytophagales bacterium]|nr:hypothetical protein [Armatimonadota bacterium]
PPSSVASRDKTLAGLLTGIVLPDLSRARRTFTRRRTEFQLLAVHAAIRRYRWQNDRLPERLEDLVLNDLLADPYTQQPLQYKVTGATTYLLSSVGPLRALDDDTVSAGTVRNSITLPPISDGWR